MTAEQSKVKTYIGDLETGAISNVLKVNIKSDQDKNYVQKFYVLTPTALYNLGDLAVNINDRQSYYFSVDETNL